MNRNRFRTRSAVALAIAAALCASVAMAQDNLSKVNGGISVESDRHVGDIDTVNGGCLLYTSPSPRDRG